MNRYYALYFSQLYAKVKVFYFLVHQHYHQNPTLRLHLHYHQRHHFRLRNMFLMMDDQLTQLPILSNRNLCLF